MSARTHPRADLGANEEIPGGRRQLALGVLVLAAVAAVAYLSTVSVNGGGPLGHPFLVRAVLPSGGPLLKDGDEVLVAGQRAGAVRDVAPGRRGSGPRVTLALDHGPVGRDARVRTRTRGLAGAVSIELERGDTRHAALRSGATLPAGAALRAVELTDVIAAFDATTREAMRRAVLGYGAGLAGRGGELGDTIAVLPAAARDLAPLARALRPRPGALAGLTRDLGATVDAVDASGRLGPLVSAGRRTLDALAPAALAATLRALPPFEGEAARTLPLATTVLRDTAATAAGLRPAVAALRAALPSLRAALRRGRGLDELSALGRAAAPVVRRARPVLVALHGPAALLGALAEPVGQLASYLAPYRREILLGPDGFTRWGGFHFSEGQASGARAVRFSMVFTCARERDPYPRPGAAFTERQRCAG
jgi:ABC-type transporter Mla subunit MlaD